MNKFREIKRGHELFQECPICGHQGWCATILGDDGNLFLICKRDLSETDANGFTYLTKTKEGNSYFIFGQREMVTSSDWKPTPSKPKKNVNKIERFTDEKLDRIYRSMFDMLILEDKHRKYLHSEGFTDEIIDSLYIKSWPVSDSVRWKEKIKTKNPKRSQIGRRLFEQYGDLTGLPGAYLSLNKKTGEYYWNFAGQDGIIFGLPNVYDEIVMGQIRLDNPDKGGKYRILSSLGKYYKNGCSPGSRISIAKPPVLGDTTCIYLTEGYKKAVISAYKLKGITITIQGVNSWSELFNVNDRGERLVDVLKRQYNSKIIIIALDNDKYSNARVMRSQKDIVDALKKEGFLMGAAEWDGYMGKGLDDMLNNGYKPMYVLV